MSEESGRPAPAHESPAFAHASEAELARILDFYGVRWSYEPDTFPIGWNLDGDVVESFSPDFYLPDLDLYVELTTLRQKLVRKKNRKLRRLRALYPDVRIKLFYARDFRMLMLKFGRMALIDELTGTTGQASPSRPIQSAPPLRAEAAEVPLRAEAAELSPAPPAPVQPSLDDGSGPGTPAGIPAAARGRRRGRRRRHAAAVSPVVPTPGDRPGSG
jgi:hypothetical protein